jgi:regulatory protein
MEKTGSSKRKSESPAFREALQKAAALCSRQEQCSGHIRDKLRQWEMGDHEADRIIAALQKEGFLDDARYAVYFARDKVKINQWGKIKIAHTLRQRKLSTENIDRALEQINEEEYFQTCLAVVRRKAAGLKDRDPFIRRGKLYRFAAGRGFEADLIYRALDRLGGD